jgi:hypothetical protein
MKSIFRIPAYPDFFPHIDLSREGAAEVGVPFSRPHYDSSLREARSRSGAPGECDCEVVDLKLQDDRGEQRVMLRVVD